MVSLGGWLFSLEMVLTPVLLKSYVLWEKSDQSTRGSEMSVKSSDSEIRRSYEWLCKIFWKEFRVRWHTFQASQAKGLRHFKWEAAELSQEAVLGRVPRSTGWGTPPFAFTASRLTADSSMNFPFPWRSSHWSPCSSVSQLPHPVFVV